MKIKNEQYKRFLRLLLAFTLILAQTLIFAFVWITEYNEDIMIPFVQKGNWFFYFVYAIILTNTVMNAKQQRHLEIKALIY